MQSVPVPAISAGDVLVSRWSARADLYEISMVPALACMKCTRYEEGIDAGPARASIGGWAPGSPAITPVSCISTES